MKTPCRICEKVFLGGTLVGWFFHNCRPTPTELRSKPTFVETGYILPEDHTHEEPKRNLRAFARQGLMQATSSLQVSLMSGDPPVTFHTEGPRQVITRDPLSPGRLEFSTINVDWTVETSR